MFNIINKTIVRHNNKNGQTASVFTQKIRNFAKSLNIRIKRSLWDEKKSFLCWKTLR